MIDEAVAESSTVEKMIEVRKDVRVGPWGVENEPAAEAMEAAAETADELIQKPADEPVALWTNEDQKGPSGTANQLEDQTNSDLTKESLFPM